jgi:hypothetical protein
MNIVIGAVLFLIGIEGIGLIVSSVGFSIYGYWETFLIYNKVMGLGLLISVFFSLIIIGISMI